MDLHEFALMTRTHSARRELMMSTSSRRFVAGQRCDQLATSKDYVAITAGVSDPGSFKQETLFCSGSRICPEGTSAPQGGKALFVWRAFPGPAQSAWRPRMGSPCRTRGTLSISVSTISANYILKGACRGVSGLAPGKVPGKYLQ